MLDCNLEKEYIMMIQANAKISTNINLTITYSTASIANITTSVISITDWTCSVIIVTDVIPRCPTLLLGLIFEMLHNYLKY